MDSVTISLLTCAPHQTVYSLYGHTAIHVNDRRTGQDIAVNYGMFSFGKPHFILRFVFGLTDYEMGIESFEEFCHIYAFYGSSVTEQILDLLPDEKIRILEALSENYLPENRVYRYNYFYDNCTTRARDMITDHLNGQVRYREEEQYPSFREMIHEWNKEHPWARFGNDMLLGIKADLPTNISEHQFIPANTMHDFDQASIVNEQGEKRSLVGCKMVVVPGREQVVEKEFPLRPLSCAIILLIVTILVCVLEYVTKKTYWGYDLLMMLASGLAGCILFVMIFSKHPTVNVNLQLLLLNPLPLFFIRRMVRRTRQHLPDRQYLFWITLLIMAFAGGFLQHYAEGMYVVALSLLIRNVKRVYTYNMTKRNIISKRQVTTATLLAMMVTAQAQITQTPKLIVNITVNQLTTDNLRGFLSSLSGNGLKKLFDNGMVYEDVSFPFQPVDNASAITAIVTGTTPYYNGIIGSTWFNRKTGKLQSCVDDPDMKGIYTTDKASAKHILTSTVGDEMKVASKGQSIVFGISEDKTAAILTAGHAANGAIWKDRYNGGWCSTSYYSPTAPQWLTTYNNSRSLSKKTKEVNTLTSETTDIALLCVDREMMGKDNVTDLLHITYDVTVPPVKAEKKKKNTMEVSWESRQQQRYQEVDQEIGRLVDSLEFRIGKQNVIFFLTSAGYVEESADDYQCYHIPTGTFYINRTANLLNMYLGAIYGSDTYVEGCSRNQIYLNLQQIEQKRLNLSDILNRSQSFLLQCEGIRNVYTSERLLTSSSIGEQQTRAGFCPETSGQLLIEIAPGWNLTNENTNENYQINSRVAYFPIIIYGAGVKAQKVSTPVSIDRLAPTIAKTIHIRAPNACSTAPLF